MTELEHLLSRLIREHQLFLGHVVAVDFTKSELETVIHAVRIARSIEVLLK